MRSPTLAAPATGALSVSLGSATEFSITADACTGTALGPGKSCNVTVRFAPTTDGQTTATLAANGTRPASSANITLTGTGLGIGPGDLELVFPGGNPDPDPNGTNNYFYDFGTGATQDFSVHNKSTTAASNTLSVFSGRPDVVLMFDGCTGQALAPDGVCHIVVTFTAPAGCNPGDLFDTPVAVVGLTNDFPNPYPYIVLDAHGTCPTPP